MKITSYTNNAQELVSAAQKVVLAQVSSKNTDRHEVSAEEVKADVHKINPDRNSMDSRG